MKFEILYFPLLSILINFSLSSKEEWGLKEEDSPAVFIEVSLEMKKEDVDDSSVFHSVDEDCTTNINKVMTLLFLAIIKQRNAFCPMWSI